MPPAATVERRHAHEAVHTDFALEVAIGKIPVDFERRRLDARALAGLVADLLHAKAVALGPHYVHAHQHFGPILAFSAAGTGIDVNDGRKLVFFVREHALELQLLYFLERGVVVGLHFDFGYVAFAVKVEEHLCIGKSLLHRFVIVSPSFDDLDFA